MAPVAENMIQYESLVEGRVTLFDIARANDVLAVRAENRRRAESKQ